MGVTLHLKTQVRSLGHAPGFVSETRCPGFDGAFAQLNLVHQLGLFLKMSDLTTVTHVSVTSWLDYCNALCIGLPLESVRKMQEPDC